MDVCVAYAESHLSCQLPLQLFLLLVQVSVMLLQLRREAIPCIVYVSHVHRLPDTSHASSSSH